MDGADERLVEVVERVVERVVTKSLLHVAKLLRRNVSWSC